MKVRILSGNDKDTVRDVEQVEAESLIASGFAEAVEEPTAPEEPDDDDDGDDKEEDGTDATTTKPSSRIRRKGRR
jgi:hypothetical protein